VTRFIETVIFDVGGPIYDDRVYADALLAGLEQLGATVSADVFNREYERCRREQAGFTRSLAERFGVRRDALTRAAARSWHYPATALFPDARNVMRQLTGRYRVGILANQPRTTRLAFERDGIAEHVDFWVLSEEVGVAKPDPAIFAYAIELANCPPERVAFVGNRLDNDIRPARRAGLRPVWLLRGEAPPEPTPEQLAEIDGVAVIRSLDALAAELERIGPACAR
jgi:HAD superfamily hydrolase (TIGR01549 family)